MSVTFEEASSSISAILIVFISCTPVGKSDLITEYTWSVVLTGLGDVENVLIIQISSYRESAPI